MTSGDPLRRPCALPVSAWEWWAAGTGDPGCKSGAASTPDELPELEEVLVAAGSTMRAPEQAEGVPALTGDSCHTLLAHQTRD